MKSYDTESGLHPQLDTLHHMAIWDKLLSPGAAVFFIRLLREINELAPEEFCAPIPLRLVFVAEMGGEISQKIASRWLRSLIKEGYLVRVSRTKYQLNLTGDATVLVE